MEDLTLRFDSLKQQRLKILDYNKTFLKEFKKPIDYNDSLRFQRKRKRDTNDKDYTIEQHDNYKKKTTRGKKKAKTPETDFINLKNRVFNEKIQKYHDKHG